MESKYSKETALIHEILAQIQRAIMQLKDWNKDVRDMNELTKSPLGMQRLAGNCMLIEAIGEGIKKVDHYTNGQLWQHRPEIPWHDVMGMRNHIAHGYFDLDISYIDGIIKNDLDPLLEAINFLLTLTED